MTESITLLAVPTAAILALVLATASLPDSRRLHSSDSFARTWRRSARRESHDRQILWLEIIRWYRSTLLISVDGLLLITVVALVAFVPGHAPSWQLLARGIIVAAASGSGILSVGLSRNMDWMWKASRSGNLYRLLTRLSATGIVTALPLTAVSVGLFILNRATPSDFALAAPLAALAFGSSFLAGTVLPIDEKIGLSSVGTVVVALGIDAGALMLTQKVTESVAWLILVGGGVVFVVVAIALQRRRS